VSSLQKILWVSGVRQLCSQGAISGTKTNRPRRIERKVAIAYPKTPTCATAHAPCGQAPVAVPGVSRKTGAGVHQQRRDDQSAPLFCGGHSRGGCRSCHQAGQTRLAAPRLTKLCALARSIPSLGVPTSDIGIAGKK
jgi:hypothetical protein